MRAMSRKKHDSLKDWHCKGGMCAIYARRCCSILLKTPLALAVYSGGKSLHGWFYCAGIAEEKISRFFSYAVSLGADPANWNRSQFARMPDGLRDNGRRQTVYFFNPRVVK